MEAFTGTYFQWSTELVQAQQLEARGLYAEALLKFREAAALSDSFGTRDARRWATYDLLAIALNENGDVPESVSTYRRSLGMVKGAIGTNNRDYEQLLGNLGMVYLAHGQVAAAENSVRQALRIEKTQPHPDPLHIATMEVRLVQVLYNRRRYKDADRLLAPELPVIEELGEAREVASVVNTLGLIRRAQHRYSESIELLGRAVSLVEEKFGPNHPLLVGPLTNLGGVYAAAGMTAEADAEYQRAMRIGEDHLPPGHPLRVTLLGNYAAFLRSTGEKRQAKAMAAEARSLARDNALREGDGMTVDVSAFRQK